MADSGDTGRFREISLSVSGLGVSGTVDILLGDGITMRLGEAGVRSPWGVWNPDFGNCFELSFRYGERQVVESVSVLRPDIEKTSGWADWRGLRYEIFCD